MIDDVATIFLTGRECPFRCLMCDLWKNTTVETVPVGAIPGQIDYALERLPRAQHVKLYNGANFFDPRAVPVADYKPIASRLRGFQSVIVENHPRFCGSRCLHFRDLLSEHEIDLEVAIGLETIHPDVLPRLNKQMTTADFRQAVSFLTGEQVRVRCFVLLRPPFLSEEEGVEWAVRSVEFAFEAGASCCTIIPTRAGNGIMEQLQATGDFAPPSLAALEAAIDSALSLSAASRRVFVDLWDAEQLAGCPVCRSARIERLRRMNHEQRIPGPIACGSCGQSD